MALRGDIGDWRSRHPAIHLGIRHQSGWVTRVHRIIPTVHVLVLGDRAAELAPRRVFAQEAAGGRVVVASPQVGIAGN